MTDPNFHILQISSFSNHPVRNSANEFILGNHVLWEANKTYVDGDGSIAPNVFSYDFKSPLASNSTLNVTIKVVNDKHLGKYHFLYGLLDGRKVFQSQVPITETTKESPIAVCVIQPDSSPRPISFMGDFTWEIAPRKQNPGEQIIQTYVCKNTTRLELYWISQDIHETFYVHPSGIAVDFLRAVLASTLDPEVVEITRRVFSDFSKKYDTVTGRSHFGLTFTGGRFPLERYIAKRTPTSPLGSLYQIVNSYDQAAMVQILGTVGPVRLIWLFMHPFGFINSTNLVDVPEKCNNPFFRSNNTLPFINPEDPNRTSFGNHVFNADPRQFENQVFHADSRQFDIRDSMYDACIGPHLGSQDERGYIKSVIDESRPHGTYKDITQKRGVLPDDVTGEELLQKLLQKYTINNSNLKAFSQVHWDDVSQWIKEVLDDSPRCEVIYHDSNIGKGVFSEFWLLSGIDGVEGDVAVQVRVETRIGTDGNLNQEQSSRVSYYDLAATLINVELDLGPDFENLPNLWTPAPFEDAEYALQYASHMTEGRVLLVSGNALIDISGGSSSSSLEPLVRKILAHTTVATPTRRSPPHVSHYVFPGIPETNQYRHPEFISAKINGLFLPFDLACDVDSLVAVATAEVEGFGILLSKYEIENNKVNQTSKVTFTFVAVKEGEHEINIRFGQVLTMSVGTNDLKINVTVVNE